MTQSTSSDPNQGDSSPSSEARGGDVTPRKHGAASSRSWLISLALHTGGLMFLALWVLPNLNGDRIESLSASITSLDDYMPEFAIAASSSSEPSESSVSSSLESPVAITSELETASFEFKPTTTPAAPPMDLVSLLEKVGPAQKVIDTSAIRSPSSLNEVRHSNGVAGAADVVSQAIRGELASSDTLVVWLLDASISLAENRVILAQRAEVFYRSENAFNTPRDRYDRPHTLMSSVVAFGRSWNEVLRPTRMGHKAVDMMTRVPIDKSGIENVMTAVQQAVRLYRDKRKWNGRLVLVVLTDESGDDILKLEPTIAMCNEEDVSVHVMGPSASMGCQKGSQLCVLTQNNRRYSFWMTVNKGPETSLPERFLLPHWHESTLPAWQQSGASVGRSEWYGGSYRERLPSGFGPYALTRLALQTGGSFTMFERLPMQASYDMELMRDYAPNYGSLDQYLQSVDGRPLRQFVSDAAEFGYVESQLFNAPRLTFMGGRSIYYPYDVEHYYFSPLDFRDRLEVALAMERKRVTQASQTLGRFIAHLSDPSIDWEYEYTKEESKRWRAGYDLTKGRLLATQARYLEYLALTDQILNSIAPTTNEVTLRPAQSLQHPDSPGLVEEAMRVLNRCVSDNGATPWEHLARWELDKPVGLRIEQGIIPKPPPRVSTGRRASPEKFSFPNL